MRERLIPERFKKYGHVGCWHCESSVWLSIIYIRTIRSNCAVICRRKCTSWRCLTVAVSRGGSAYQALDHSINVLLDWDVIPPLYLASIIAVIIDPLNFLLCRMHIPQRTEEYWPGIAALVKSSEGHVCSSAQHCFVERRSFQKCHMNCQHRKLAR